MLKDNEGYVYVLKNVNKKEYKIGQTKNLKRRLYAYNTHSNEEFKLIKLYCCNNYILLEKHFLEFFSGRKIKNEWFYLSEDSFEKMDKIFSNHIFDLILKSYEKKRNTKQN